MTSATNRPYKHFPFYRRNLPKIKRKPEILQHGQKKSKHFWPACRRTPQGKTCQGKKCRQRDVLGLLRIWNYSLVAHLSF